MKSFKKILYICIFTIIFSIVGYSLMNIKNQLPKSKPKNFNFIFKYGVNAKNQLDTVHKQYTKDMVIEHSITTKLTLSEEEMKDIYLEMKKINILGYPDNFQPKSNMRQTPFETYSIKIIFDGEEKNIYWKDNCVAKTKQAVQLRGLFEKIKKIIINNEAYKKLPEPKSFYL